MHMQYTVLSGLVREADLPYTWNTNQVWPTSWKVLITMHQEQLIHAYALNTYVVCTKKFLLLQVMDLQPCKQSSEKQLLDVKQ